MVRSASSDELLQRARRAAGTRNVREAVRDLALHALRSRLLTAQHIATVARTVAEGIESSDIPPTEPVRETHRGAWAGLEDAVGQALRAVELAAREFAEGRARLTPMERDQLLAEIAQLERSLGEGWGYPRTVPLVLRERIGAVAGYLRTSVVEEPTACGAGGAPASGVLSCFATGVLLGLSEGSIPLPEGIAP
jgi:hypothetical protein